MTLKAILFDSDGVLLDSERPFFEATREAFATAGAELTVQQWAKWFLGEGRRSREVARLVGIPPSSIDALIEMREEIFWRRIAAGVEIMPGVRETLEILSKKFRLAVVTGANRERFERANANTGLKHFFETVITTEDHENAKPSPWAYLTAAETLRLAPSECAAVEDSPRGAKAALAAGMRCFVIPTLLTDLDICPARCEIVKDFASIAGILV